MPSTVSAPAMSLQTITSPVAQPPAKTSRTERVTGKVAAAIEAMVWQGLPRAKAAEAAGMSEHGLYKALRKPPVKAHYLSECEVLRTSGRARRIHRLEAMLEQDDNKAAVINAALALDRMPDQALGGAAASVPGLQIVIVQASPLMAHERSFDAKPLISNEAVHDDE